MANITSEENSKESIVERKSDETKPNTGSNNTFVIPKVASVQFTITKKVWKC